MLLLPCQSTESVEARKSAVRTPEKPFLVTVIRPEWCHRGAGEVGDSLRCGASEPKVPLKERNRWKRIRYLDAEVR